MIGLLFNQSAALAAVRLVAFGEPERVSFGAVHSDLRLQSASLPRTVAKWPLPASFSEFCPLSTSSQEPRHQWPS
jgi:hypothetical protein